MKLNIKNSKISDFETNLLCVPVYEQKDNNDLSYLNTALDGLIDELIY